MEDCGKCVMSSMNILINMISVLILRETVMSLGDENDSSVWTGNSDSGTTVMTFDPEDRGVQTEVYQPVTECVPAEVPLVVPVTGESFCQCPTQTDLSSHTQPDEYTHECTCGEDESGCVWVWDEEYKSSSAQLSCSNRKVSFHPDYSCGTAAIRGSTELQHGQHFWEIKMTSPVYGTDMMVGIGTGEVNLDEYRHSFCSLLGSDSHSWGLSYTGLLQHKGSKVSFSPRFGQGSIIGLHLDMWNGTLTFYKNRHWIGVAATGLQNKSFYPMVCSTAAKSSMKVISSCSSPTSLQYLCCSHLRRCLPDCPDPLSALQLPPGLKSTLSQQLGWVLRLHRPETSSHTHQHTHYPQSHLEEEEEDVYPDSASYTPAQIHLTFPAVDTDVIPHPDSASFTPVDTHLTSHPDSASFTPVDTHLTSHPDSASFTPAQIHLTFPAVDTDLTSHPDSASFTPADTQLTSHPDSASFTPADTHLTSHPDSASFTPADTHLTSHPDSASFTPAQIHLTFPPVDTDLTSHPDSASFTPADTHLSSHLDSASFDSSSYLIEAAASYSDSCHPDSASCKDLDVYYDLDLFSDLGFCSDSASCPCCDAPLSLVANDVCHSSASHCSGPASRPASPLPDHPYCSASPLPDSAHSRPSSAPGSDSDSCQRKRCRWT